MHFLKLDRVDKVKEQMYQAVLAEVEQAGQRHEKALRFNQHKSVVQQFQCAAWEDVGKAWLKRGDLQKKISLEDVDEDMAEHQYSNEATPPSLEHPTHVQGQADEVLERTKDEVRQRRRQELRYRLLTSVKASYWKQFGAGLLRSRGARHLNALVERAIDEGGDVNQEWRQLRGLLHVGGPFMSKLTRYTFKLPLVHNLALRYLFADIEYGYDVISGFIHAREEALDSIHSLMNSSENEIEETAEEPISLHKVTTGGRTNRTSSDRFERSGSKGLPPPARRTSGRARLLLGADIQEIIDELHNDVMTEVVEAQTKISRIQQVLPEIARAITSNTAARSVLNRQLATVQDLRDAGVLEIAEYERARAAVETATKQLHRKHTLKMPTSEELLKGVSWLHLCSEETVRAVTQAGKEVLFEEGELLLEAANHEDRKLQSKHKAGVPHIYLIVRGTAEVDLMEHQSSTISPPLLMQPGTLEQRGATDISEANMTTPSPRTRSQGSFLAAQSASNLRRKIESTVRLSTGTVVGDIEVLTGKPVQHTVTAVGGPLVAIDFPGNTMLQLLDKYEDLAERMWLHASRLIANNLISEHEHIRQRNNIGATITHEMIRQWLIDWSVHQAHKSGVYMTFKQPMVVLCGSVRVAAVPRGHSHPNVVQQMHPCEYEGFSCAQDNPSETISDALQANTEYSAKSKMPVLVDTSTQQKGAHFGLKVQDLDNAPNDTHQFKWGVVQPPSIWAPESGCLMSGHLVGDGYVCWMAQGTRYMLPPQDKTLVEISNGFGRELRRLSVAALTIEKNKRRVHSPSLSNDCSSNATQMGHLGFRKGANSKRKSELPPMSMHKYLCKENSESVVEISQASQKQTWKIMPVDE